MEGCPKKFQDARKRRLHLIDKHKYPRTFSFSLTQMPRQSRQGFICLPDWPVAQRVAPDAMDGAGSEAETNAADHVDATDSEGDGDGEGGGDGDGPALAPAVAVGSRVPVLVAFGRGQGRARGFAPRPAAVERRGRRPSNSAGAWAQPFQKSA